MPAPLPRRRPRPVQILADRAFSAVEQFLHIEAVSGIVLILAAAVALIWANSPAGAGYAALWHTPLTLGLGSFSISRDLHFWINDGLMTVFFLVVGMEIRREIHEGALASLRLAALPLAAALGGVMAPALIFLALNGEALPRQGWAVPTATDIAFALGVLALLGKAIPTGVRILLMALAILDDIVAVLIIAAFYSGGLEAGGLWAAGAGIAAVLFLQRIGIGTAWAYVAPGALLWLGLLQIGVHPTLAGVALGLLTPVLSRPSRRPPLDQAKRAVDDLRQAAAGAHDVAKPLRRLRLAQREVLPPVVRVQQALHPWVAYGAMPLFALANAGVRIDGVDLDAGGSWGVLLGVWLGLVFGKPLGVLTVSWLVVKLGWCRLPPGVTWTGVALVGLLAGIGFTMSIFIATLAFAGAENLLGAAKLGVLLASLVAALLGLAWGKLGPGLRSTDPQAKAPK